MLKSSAIWNQYRQAADEVKGQLKHSQRQLDAIEQTGVSLAAREERFKVRVTLLHYDQTSLSLSITCLPTSLPPYLPTSLPPSLYPSISPSPISPSPPLPLPLPPRGSIKYFRRGLVITMPRSSAPSVAHQFTMLKFYFELFND